MFCSNCGQKLEKEDKFCKSCGFPNRDYQENNNNNNLRFNSLNENLNNNQTKVNMSMNNQNSFNMPTNNSNQINFNMPNNNHNSFNPNNQVEKEIPVKEEKINVNNQSNSNSLIDRMLYGENKKLYMVIGVLSIIALICIILVIVKMVNKLNDNSNNIYQNNGSVQTINLGGTNYQIPSGYEIKDTSNNQYSIQSSDFAFNIILTDGDYNSYKNNLSVFVSQIGKIMEQQGCSYVGVDNPKIGGREYIIFEFTLQNKYVLYYVTASNYSNYTYSGVAANTRGTYDVNDFLDISTMLANPSSSFDTPNIEAGSLEDAFDKDIILEK